MRVCYLNLNPASYTIGIPARDAVYLRGLKENGAEILECRDDSPGFAKFIRLYKKHKNFRGKYDVMLVGYTAYILVPFARLITNKKVIFNALCSLYEGIVIAREKVAWFSFQSLYAWLIDFLAFNSAHLSLLESEEQIKFVAAKFFVPKKKLLKAWTGVDDSLFYTDPDAKKLPTFTVLFRGAFLPESGVEYAVDAFKILKKHNINLRIIGRGEFDPLVEKRLKEFDSSNVEWIRGKKMPFEDLRRKIQECHISLGQLSNHDRLNRTVPHKAFESIAMKIPYLTARNKGILELLIEDETCFCCTPADAKDLAEKILEIKNNPELMAKVAESAYQLYTREFTPRVLAKRVVDRSEEHT